MTATTISVANERALTVPGDQSSEILQLVPEGNPAPETANDPITDLESSEILQLVPEGNLAPETANDPITDLACPSLVSQPCASMVVSIPSKPLCAYPNLELTKAPFQNKPLAVELCAGSATFSWHCRKRGFRILPVDHSRNVHHPKVPMVTIDLACANQVGIIIEASKQVSFDLMWAEVPCGTCSRAREIPFPGQRKGPKPLRDAIHVRGLPNLCQADMQKVVKANAIYDTAIQIVLDLHSQGKMVVIENPRGSWLWAFPEYAKLLSIGFIDVDFQHCKWVPDDRPCRPKWTRLRTNVHELLLLAGPCTQLHEHLRWGILADGSFATAGEAEYSNEMCSAILDILEFCCKQRKLVLRPEHNLDISSEQPHKKRRAAVGRQPRGRKLPNLISEFSHTEQVSDQALAKLPPKSFKLLRTVQDGGDSDAQKVIGMFRSPQEYFDAALQMHSDDRENCCRL